MFDYFRCESLGEARKGGGGEKKLLTAENAEN
jgi:hypothetical protein